MTDHKFTDEEVIKALECCRGFGDCSLCPYDGAVFDDEPDCVEKLHTYTLALINRQKAEIERLTTLAELGRMRANDYRAMRDKAKNAKAEAIKEFAERLKERAYTSVEWSHGAHPQVVECDDIDDLVEEMTEEKT